MPDRNFEAEIDKWVKDCGGMSGHEARAEDLMRDLLAKLRQLEEIAEARRMKVS